MIATAIMIAALLQAGDEPQWTLGRTRTGEPVAAFLSWDYSSVILRARCAGNRTVIDYHGGGDDVGQGHDVALVVDEGRYSLTREANGRGFVLSDTALQALASGHWVGLDAPNEMEEPWHLGRAFALRELAILCGSARRSDG